MERLDDPTRQHGQRAGQAAVRVERPAPRRSPSAAPGAGRLARIRRRASSRGRSIAAAAAAARRRSRARQDEAPASGRAAKSAAPNATSSSSGRRRARCSPDSPSRAARASTSTASPATRSSRRRAGRVTYIGSGIPGLGKLVVIKHDNGFITVYAHNRDILVKEQQAVARGQKIAELGSTDADRPKLHFQIRKGAAAVDPLRLLAGALSRCGERLSQVVTTAARRTRCGCSA